MIAAVATAGSAQGQASSTHGPARGSLVLQGGVGLNRAIASAFVALAGGPASHIVVIPTASVGDAGPPGMADFLARRMKENFGVAADTSRGRFSGRVYATWEAGDFGARLSFVNGERVRVEEGTHRSVAISWSDDHRQTWASPVSLEVAGAGPSYMSTVAVSSKGIVGVLWLQHERYEQNPRCYRAYFAASIDGGRSFTKPVPVSDSVSCPAKSVTETGFFKYRHRGGEYIGLAAATVDGSFHAVWSDARDGSFRTFTDRIAVDGNLSRSSQKKTR